jgi:hypothetical protein
MRERSDSVAPTSSSSRRAKASLDCRFIARSKARSRQFSGLALPQRRAWPEGPSGKSSGEEIANVFTVECELREEHGGFRIRETQIGPQLGADLIGGSVYEIDPGEEALAQPPPSRERGMACRPSWPAHAADAGGGARARRR